MAELFSREWWVQADKDTGAFWDEVGNGIQEGPEKVLNEIATGDVFQGIVKVQKDFADLVNPNNPDQNGVVDQIETTIDQPPTSDYVVDQIESTNNQQSTPDYVVGPDFNNPAPELPSPVFETFDPLTNPNPGLEVRAFEYGAVGVDALSIDSIDDRILSYLNPQEIADLMNILLAAGPVGGYDSIDSLNESLLNPIFEVAEIPTF